LAESVGFEPTIRINVYTLSKRAPSATRPTLQACDSIRALDSLALIVALRRITLAAIKNLTPCFLRANKSCIAPIAVQDEHQTPMHQKYFLNPVITLMLAQ